MRTLHKIKTYGKNLVKPLLYRFPPVFLSPPSTYVWYDTLVKTNLMKGDVVEVGCYLGATAALSFRMLESMRSTRDYYVIDTFGGFVEEQFDGEMRMGGAGRLRHQFSSNTPALARWVMDKHGGKGVKMITADITTIPDKSMPGAISACLLDIDLADAIYLGLGRIYPKLVPGGVITVDDCDDDTLFKARIGYERFVAEHGLPTDIRHGMGMVVKA